MPIAITISRFFLLNSSCLFVNFLNFLVSSYNLCPSLKKKITQQVLGIYQLSAYLTLFVCTLGDRFLKVRGALHLLSGDPN